MKDLNEIRKLAGMPIKESKAFSFINNNSKVNFGADIELAAEAQDAFIGLVHDTHGMVSFERGETDYRGHELVVLYDKSGAPVAWWDLKEAHGFVKGYDDHAIDIKDMTGFQRNYDDHKKGKM